MSILDDIAAEVAQLTDAEIAATANALLARKERDKAKMTPDKKQQMKDREKRKRLLNKEIMKLAKAKGFIADAEAAAEATAAAKTAAA